MQPMQPSSFGSRPASPLDEDAPLPPPARPAPAAAAAASKPAAAAPPQPPDPDDDSDFGIPNAEIIRYDSTLPICRISRPLEGQGIFTVRNFDTQWLRSKPTHSEIL